MLPRCLGPSQRQFPHAFGRPAPPERPSMHPRARLRGRTLQLPHRPQYPLPHRKPVQVALIYRAWRPPAWRHGSARPRRGASRGGWRSGRCRDRGSFVPHQINGSQRVGGGHVRPCPLDSPNGTLGLAQVILTGCQGIPKGLPDDVLKVRVHVEMRAQPAAKEQPRRSGASARPPGYGHPRAARASRPRRR